MSVMPASYYHKPYPDSPGYKRRPKFESLEEEDYDRRGKWTQFLGYGTRRGGHNPKFEDALIDPSYAVSPMKAMRHFLDLGTLVGIFPAKRGDRHIHFDFECCSVQTVWSLFFTFIWFLWGLIFACYCATNEGDITKTNQTGIGTVLQVKTTIQTLSLTSTDQIVVVGTPFIMLVAWLFSIILGWSRIFHVSHLCYYYCTRGLRISTEPENTVIAQFLVNYVIFVIGQTIVNIQIALVYCSNETKQILFAVLVTLWMLPIYVVVMYNGYLFSQFTFSLTEYFRHLRADIDSQSVKIQTGNVLYAEVVKKGLPRRYDRLHDNSIILDQAYGPVLLYEYLFYHVMLVASLYMSISSLIQGVKLAFVPWWFIGYTLLVIHHLVRLYQLCTAGHGLQEEMTHVLNMLSQFAYMHGDVGMLCLTVARRPLDSVLTLAGFAGLRRSLVAKTLAFVLITMLLIANYKLKEY